MKKVGPVLGVLACAVVATALWRTTTRSAAYDGAVVREDPATDKADFSIDAPRVEGVPTAASRDSLSNEVTLIRGVVVDSDGAPVASADVRWLALQPEDLELTPPWPMASCGVPTRAAVDVVTASDGSFAFRALPAPDLKFGSTLIAYHPQHYPNGVDIAVDPKDWPKSARIVLEPAKTVEVRVLDGQHAPIKGAAVHHTSQCREVGSLDLTPIAQHERFLSQAATTDSSGRVEMCPFPGEQAFWAEARDLVSEPWSGSNPATVVLTLGASFSIDGSLALPDWSAWDPVYRGERRVLVSARDGGLWRPLALLRDVEAGEWGPLRISLGDYARFKVRLEGTPIVPIEEEFDRPRASAHRRFDFVAERQADLWLMVQGEDEQPVPTAVAEARWEGEFAANHVVGAAKPDGTLYLATFPPGVIYCRVWAPGYGPASFRAEVPSPDTLVVDLRRGGLLHGRCMHDGTPVEAFEVIYTSQGVDQRTYSKVFVDRKDGSFEIDSLGPGDWSVYAASSQYPSSKPASLTMTAGGSSEVLLDLPTGIQGGGRIVAQSGEPVSNARVQPYCSGGMTRTLPWGPPVFSASDGSFEMGAFVAGSNFITVEADGFAEAEVSARGVPGEFLDWGDIRVQQPQTLRLSLLGIEELDGVGVAQLHAFTGEGYILPDRHFDASGRVEFEGVPPGDMKLVVSWPDDSFARLQLQLEPGKDWNFDLKVAGSQQLDVSVLDAAGKALSSPPVVYAAAQEDSGVLVLRGTQANADGIASFAGLRARNAQVLVFDSNHEALASREVAFTENPFHVEIRVGEKPIRVRVVDGDGAPLSSAWVMMRSGGSLIVGLDETNAEGWAELFGLSEGRAFLDVSHGIAGRRQGIEIDASVREHEVILAPSGTLALRIEDGDVPLEKVITRIEWGPTLSPGKETDGAGLVRYERLGEGSYRIECRRDDCWPVTVDQPLGQDERATRGVQMRRLAELELTVQSPNGIPVAGVDVDLRSDEFDAQVSTWLQEGKIVSPTGLRSDGLGKIRVSGLPRGEYSWTVPGIDGASGAFQLAPGAANESKVQLPE